MPTVSQGDLLIAHIYTRRVSATAATITPPSGWNTITTETYVDGVNNIRGGYYWKIAGGSEASSYTWTFNASVDTLRGLIVRITGAHKSSPIEAYATLINQNPASSTAVVPSVTTTRKNCLLWGSLNHHNGNVTGPNGWNTRYYSNNFFAGGSKDFTGPGPTGTATFSLPLVARSFQAMIAIRPG